MNMMTGHAFLKKTFGIVPKHAWHPDTFGHSAATPELFARMGFESISFARIDMNDKAQRMRSKELEFIWQPTYEGTDPEENSTGFSSSHGIFTHVMHELYGGACGFDMYLGYADEEVSKNHFKSRSALF